LAGCWLGLLIPGACSMWISFTAQVLDASIRGLPVAALTGSS
jgi:hypothetical protein